MKTSATRASRLKASLTKAATVSTKRRGRPIKLSVNEMVAVEGIRAAMVLANSTAVSAGWYTDPKTGLSVERNVGEVIALMHSELSEALEAHRKDLMDDKLPHRRGIEVELADCLIRIFDTGAALGLDLAGALVEKNRFNQARLDHKLSERNKPNGKKF